MSFIIFPLVTAIGIYIIMLKIGLINVFRVKETRRVADGGLDLGISLGLVALLAGSFSGMMVAAITGLMVSGMLYVTRLLVKPTKSIGGKLNGVSNRVRKVSIFR